MILEGVDSGLGKGVDRAGSDEVVDVQGVGVGGVLGRRRRPQRPLHAGAVGRELGPPRAGELVAEQLVGELGLGDSSAATEGECFGCTDGFEAPIDFGVDPADEEGRDAVHTPDVAARVGVLLESRQVGLDDLASTPTRVTATGSLAMAERIKTDPTFHVAGLAVLFVPRFGGYLVAGWLLGIIVNLVSIGGYGDVALRDFGLLLAALTLARLATAFLPATGAPVGERRAVSGRQP